jgi:hypothetical protein
MSSRVERHNNLSARRQCATISRSGFARRRCTSLNRHDRWLRHHHPRGRCAGASLAAELGTQSTSAPRVLLLEMEDQPGRHATGRSAAMFFESCGNPTVRALTRARRAFLERPPAGFAGMPLRTPRAGARGQAAGSACPALGTIRRSKLRSAVISVHHLYRLRLMRVVVHIAVDEEQVADDPGAKSSMPLQRQLRRWQRSPSRSFHSGFADTNAATARLPADMGHRHPLRRASCRSARP